MTKIQNSKQVLVIGYWNLKFIWNLVLEFWDFIFDLLITSIINQFLQLTRLLFFPTKICFNHLLIAGHLVIAAFGDFDAVIQGDDPIRYGSYDIQFVFNDQDRIAVHIPEGFDKGRDLDGFLGIHAGRGLVQQQ